MIFQRPALAIRQSYLEELELKENGVQSVEDDAYVIPLPWSSKTKPQSSFQVLDLNSATVLQRLRAAKSPAFREFWPSTCDGHTADGRFMFKTEKQQKTLDGFYCLHMNDDRIAMAMAPVWFSQMRGASGNRVCCNKECEEEKYSECDHVNLGVAASLVKSAIDSVEVGSEDNGGVFSVKVLHTLGAKLPKADQESGILEEMALRLPLGAIDFKRKTGDLTPRGMDNLQQMASKLSALLTMMSTGHNGAKILLCAHGSTTNCFTRKDAPAGLQCSYVGNKLKFLPGARAQTVADEFKEILPTVQVGEPHGHFAWEHKSMFPGGRYGTVILKAYDGSKEKPPECQLEDLYRYVEMVDPGSLPTKNATLSVDKSKKDVPPEKKRISTTTTSATTVISMNSSRVDEGDDSSWHPIPRSALILGEDATNSSENKKESQSYWSLLTPSNIIR